MEKSAYSRGERGAVVYQDTKDGVADNLGIDSERIEGISYTHTHPQERCCGSVAGNGTWVGTDGVLSRCRFRSPISNQIRDA